VQIGRFHLYANNCIKIIRYNYIQMIHQIDLIGFYGPLIIAFINCVYLWRRKIFLITYALFLIVNSFINGILKNIIQEPRPIGQIYLNEYDIVPNTAPSKYGMPSGHAQSTGYSITFLYLVAHSPALLIISMFIGSLTIYQRFKYRRHTISQLISGLSIGSLFAIISYKVAQILITQQTLNHPRF
jgi:membrane-associated phospholipid phosphatase